MVLSRSIPLSSVSPKFYFKLVLILILFFISASDEIIPQQSKISKGVNYLTEFIASPEFKKLKDKSTDIQLMDSLYLKSLNFYNGDISEALLAVTFAVIPYKKVPVQIPLIKLMIYYPLIAHNDSLVKLKNENLPKYLLFDSPKNDYGDKDKLAHFFGSAFLSYNSLFFDFAVLFGYFVEVFEETFQIQSEINQRDLRVNLLGIEFGKKLKCCKDFLPSKIILQEFIENE